MRRGRYTWRICINSGECNDSLLAQWSWGCNSNFGVLFGTSYFPSQIDSLDTLALLGDRVHFSASVEWIGKNLRFDIVSTYFVFVLQEIKLINNLFSTCLSNFNSFI